jgi:hypothetical protein
MCGQCGCRSRGWSADDGAIRAGCIPAPLPSGGAFRPPVPGTAPGTARIAPGRPGRVPGPGVRLRARPGSRPGPVRRSGRGRCRRRRCYVGAEAGGGDSAAGQQAAGGGGVGGRPDAVVAGGFRLPARRGEVSAERCAAAAAAAGPCAARCSTRPASSGHAPSPRPGTTSVPATSVPPPDVAFNRNRARPFYSTQARQEGVTAPG